MQKSFEKPALFAALLKAASMLISYQIRLRFFSAILVF